MIESLTPLKYSDASRQKASRQDWKPFVGLSWHWFRFFPQTSVFTLKIFLSFIETNVASSGGELQILARIKISFSSLLPKDKSKESTILLILLYKPLTQIPHCILEARKIQIKLMAGFEPGISAWKVWHYGKIMVSNKLLIGRLFDDMSKLPVGRASLICFASKSKIAG